MQNVAKFKGKDVTGVFAVQCVHHQCFKPGGMVDLQKGKSLSDSIQAITFFDFAFQQVL